jgi:hypothetical protein
MLLKFKYEQNYKHQILLEMAVVNWQGDINPAMFQNLAYNSTTNALSLTPFGNTVSLDLVQPEFQNGLSATLSNLASWAISGDSGGDAIMNMITQQAGKAVFNLIKENVNLSTIQTFAYEILPNLSNAMITYTQQSTVKGEIDFVSSIGGGSGGVVLTGEDGTSLSIGNGAVSFGSNGVLTGVSTINGAAYPPTFIPASFVPVTFSSNFSIGNQGYITSNAFFTNIATAAVETGATYRISMNPTFNNTTTPAAGDYLHIIGTSLAGPNDTIDFITFNLNWTGTGNTPGLTDNYGQAVSGVMTALDSNYYFQGFLNPGCSVSTLVQFGNANPIVIERIA